jgi:ferrochelatase
MSQGKEAVLMLGFGGPTSFDEVRPFILNVTRGRSVSQERIEAVINQYRLIGGKSPFKELTERQARQLEGALTERGCQMPVEPGFLYWAPYISDAIKKLVNDKVSYAVAIVMAPHRTEASFERYVRAVEEALAEVNDSFLRIEFAPSWHSNPLFIEAVADRCSEKLNLLALPERSSTQLIFTAHSVPTYMSDASGYARQITESAQLVCDKLGESNWKVAYQSRSGSPHQPWLEPDIRDAIFEAKQNGVRNVVVMPVGFVCDHVEVLFDLDVQAAEFAAENGVNMLRAETVGCHPKFIEMLAELLKARVSPH